MVCYSLIIFCNFKNFVNFWGQESGNIGHDFDMGMVSVTIDIVNTYDDSHSYLR